MWNSIKSYLQFCSFAFREKFSSGRLHLLKRVVWPIIVFVVGFVVSGYFGIPLRNLVLPIYKLLPGTVWLILVLALTILLLLLLMEGARRYHARIVSEVFLTNGKAFAEFRNRSGAIDDLTVLLGRSLALYFLLHGRTWSDSLGPSLTVPEIRYQEADIWNALQDHYGSDYVDNYFRKLGEISDDVSSQANRMKAHYDTLDGLRKSLYDQRLVASVESLRASLKQANMQNQRSVQKVGSMPNSKTD